jgi:hypothetical protein
VTDPPATASTVINDLEIRPSNVHAEPVNMRQDKAKRSTIAHVFAIPQDNMDRCHDRLAIHDIHSQQLATLGTTRKGYVWIVAGASKVHIDRFTRKLKESQEPQSNGYSLAQLSLAATVAAAVTWSALTFAY